MSGFSRIYLARRRWLEEEGAGRGVVDGTGGVVWGSARVLCEHLAAHPEVWVKPRPISTFISCFADFADQC